jgi:iron complex outermembrane recepter protein
MKPISLWIVSTVLCCAMSAQANEASTIISDINESIVISPTRLKQSLLNVPAAVTVITAETIAQHKIRSIVEALELVPGVAITKIRGNDYRVNYQGSKITLPRRLTVLIDGVSMYRPILARIDWKELPISIDDIARIEITRGSNSAAYGPNAMTATINIITKHPNDTERLFARINVGTQAERSVYVGGSGALDRTTIRASIANERDEGFDSFTDRLARDSTDLTKGSIRAVTSLNNNTTIDASLGFSKTFREVPYADASQITFPDQRAQELFFTGSFTKVLSPEHELQIKANYSQNAINQEWVTCQPTAFFLPELYALWAANSRYANEVIGGRKPSGGTPQDDLLALRAITAIRALGSDGRTPNCATANQNLRQSRTSLEIQDTFAISPELRVVAGIAARRERGESQTFLGTLLRYDSTNIYTHFEYKLPYNLTINGGAFAEKIDGLKASLQPRMSLHFGITPNQSIRAILAQGSRSPDMLERDGLWSYHVNDLHRPINGSRSAVFFQNGQSKVKLSSEKNINREIGYVYVNPTAGMSVDIKGFYDSYYNLISEKLQIQDFNPTNNGRLTLTGTEIQGSLILRDGFRLLGHYAYLENRDATLITENTQHARHSGSIAIYKRYSSQWDWSLRATVSSAEAIGQAAQNKVDFSVGKRFNINDAHVTTSLMLRYDPISRTSYYSDANLILRGTNNNKLRAFFQIAIGL